VDAEPDLQSTELREFGMDDLRKTMANLIGQDAARFTAPMVRLVAKGKPVAPERLAAASGVPVEKIESWLRTQPGTDWDEDGRLLGFGLTQRPTRHRYIVDGRVLFTFCAADTLIFTPILGRPAIVESSCLTTSQPIRVELTPEAVTLVDPPTTMVSQVSLARHGSDIRSSCCDHGHFFASESAAQEWCHAHPDGGVRPVREFFAIALDVCRDLGWTA
jgi:alkylmercury lyase